MWLAGALFFFSLVFSCSLSDRRRSDRRLDLIQLSDYRAEFMKQAVSGSELFELSEDDLRSLGVTKIGHKKRLVKKIRQLRRGLDCAFTLEDNDDTHSFSSDGSHLRCFFFLLTSPKKKKKKSLGSHYSMFMQRCWKLCE